MSHGHQNTNNSNSIMALKQGTISMFIVDLNIVGLYNLPRVRFSKVSLYLPFQS